MRRQVRPAPLDHAGVDVEAEVARRTSALLDELARDAAAAAAEVEHRLVGLGRDLGEHEVAGRVVEEPALDRPDERAHLDRRERQQGRACGGTGGHRPGVYQPAGSDVSFASDARAVGGDEGAVAAAGRRTPGRVAHAARAGGRGPCGHARHARGRRASPRAPVGQPARGRVRPARDRRASRDARRSRRAWPGSWRRPRSTWCTPSSRRRWPRARRPRARRARRAARPERRDRPVAAAGAGRARGPVSPVARGRASRAGSARRSVRGARTVALTEEDAVRLRALAGERRARHGRARAVPAGAGRGARPLAGRPAVVLVGSGGWLPNQRGTAWFVRAVWPEVRARAARAPLHVFGGARSGARPRDLAPGARGQPRTRSRPGRCWWSRSCSARRPHENPGGVGARAARGGHPRGGVRAGGAGRTRAAARRHARRIRGGARRGCTASPRWRPALVAAGTRAPARRDHDPAGVAAACARVYEEATAVVPAAAV